ncbi:MAG: HAD family hydrolase [Sphingomonadaceae bacterium]
MIPSPRPRAILFDMDGLLLDTERLVRDAILESAAYHGYPMDEALFLQLVGVPIDGNRRILRAVFGEAFPFDCYRTRYEDRLQARITCEGLPLKPGAAELVDHARAGGLPIAVATSTNRAQARHHLGLAGLLEKLDRLVAREDVANPKPHPEPYLMAAAALRVDPAACLALEDSANGARSALAAGMRVIVVPDLQPPPPDVASGCLAIAADLHEVRGWLAAVFAEAA